MKTLLTFGFLLWLIAAPSAEAQLVGDTWVGRRGDHNPGLRYNALVKTSTGRLIAAGDSGSLMVSDDGGNTWTFRLLTTVDGPVRVPVTAVAELTVQGTGSKRLVALSTELVPEVANPFSGSAKTTLFISDNNGDTWIKKPFPFASATLGTTEFPGVNLYGLFITPGGELLAFGTTTTNSNVVFQWNIGGLIYRSTDADTWTLAKFAFGAISVITNASSRMTAVGSSSILDSADGSNWDGYFLRDAVVKLPNNVVLDTPTLERLRFLDVAVKDGVHVAHAVTYVPFDPLIDTTTVARRFVLQASDPFGRQWTATEFPPAFDPGAFLATSSGLLGFGASGVEASTDFGATWTARDSTVSVPTRTFVKNGSTITAVGSSAEVWNSTSDGQSFAKIFNQPSPPDLYLQGTFGGTLFAFGAGSFSNDTVYVSTDNGANWTVRAKVEGYQIVQAGNRLIMSTSSSTLVRVSTDGGFTWNDKSTGSNPDSGVGPMTVTATGRIILSAEGKDFPTGKFYISDDGGETWQARVVGTAWQEYPSAIFTSSSGRIIAVTNSFAVFNPRILRSDDNGDTWTSDEQLQTLPGLDPISNQPSRRVITITSIQQNPQTRRLLMVGQDEILTSDDDGESWQVRVNYSTPFVPPNLFWAIPCVTYSDGRWVGIHTRRDAGFSQTTLHFSLVSSDDGNTWRERPLPLNTYNTFLTQAMTGVNGRVVVAGSNGAIYTTDPPAPPRAAPVQLTVREGDMLSIPIPRPPIPGAVTAQYRTQDGTAVGGRDYTAAVGSLSWTDTESGTKMITVQTIDNLVADGSRSLTLSLAFASASVGGTLDTAITILDNDGTGTAGIQLEGDDALVTSVEGGQATLQVALAKKPASDVTIALSGVDPLQGAAAPAALTFTPANWQRQQAVTFTGLSNLQTDGDATYKVTLTASSKDTAYDKLHAAVFVTNLGNSAQPIVHKRYVGQQLVVDLSGFGNLQAVTGIPAGMKWDRAGKALTGKPAKAGVFVLKLTILEGPNKKLNTTTSLRIDPLPPYLSGSFYAVVQPNALSGGLGGTLSMKSLSTGAASGMLRMGTANYPFLGGLIQISGGALEFQGTIKRKTGQTPLTLTLQSHSDHFLTGSITDGSQTAQLNGWMLIWSKTNPIAKTQLGPVNASLENQAGWQNDGTVPQGCGFATLNIASTGFVKWIGKLADGTAISGSTPFGPKGQVSLLQMLYGSKGFLKVAGTVSPAKYLTATGTWQKSAAATPAGRTYPAGFGLDQRGAVGLTVAGGPWTLPAKNQNLISLLGLNSADPNLQLNFTAGGVGASATKPDTSCSVNAANKITFPTGAASNPGGVKLSIDPKTGLVSGGFTLLDPNPEKSGAQLARPVSFQALYVPGQNRARGFFVLPQLANPPTTTSKNSPMLSGAVVLSKK